MAQETYVKSRITIHVEAERKPEEVIDPLQFFKHGIEDAPEEAREELTRNYKKYQNRQEYLTRVKEEEQAREEGRIEARREMKQPANTEDKSQNENVGKDNEILAKLTPMFWGQEDKAREFLDKARTLKPKGITALVNELVSANTLAETYRKRDLWKVLHDASIYPHSEANWNYQVK